MKSFHTAEKERYAEPYPHYGILEKRLQDGVTFIPHHLQRKLCQRESQTFSLDPLLSEYDHYTDHYEV